MQKYFKFLNFRLDVVVNDVFGLTGLKIIEDICNGNLDPYSLAEHQYYNCRKPKEEIVNALNGNNRIDYLFGLKQGYDSYKFFQKKIKACNKEIERLIKKKSEKILKNKSLKQQINHIKESIRMQLILKVLIR